jgi:hypothetical protein
MIVDDGRGEQEHGHAHEKQNRHRYDHFLHHLLPQHIFYVMT